MKIGMAFYGALIGCVTGYFSAQYFALWGGFVLMAEPYSPARNSLVPGHILLFASALGIAGFFLGQYLEKGNKDGLNVSFDRQDSVPPPTTMTPPAMVLSSASVQVPSAPPPVTQISPSPQPSMAPPQGDFELNQLERLGSLKERGILTEAEFLQLKRELLGM